MTAKDVAFTFNYIIKNQLLNLSGVHGRHHQGRGDQRHDVQIYTKAPKANMLQMVVPILPEHIWSKVSGKAAANSYQNDPPIVGYGPFQIVEWQKGKFVRLSQPGLLGRQAQGRRGHLPAVYESRHHDRRTSSSGPSTAPSTCRPSQFKQLGTEPGLTTNNATSWQFTELGLNCYDSPNSLGNPVLLDQQFRQARELGGRSREGRLASR